MAVYIPDSPEDLIKKIQTHTLAPFPEWAESSIKKLRSEFRGKDADPSAPLIVTGHQPIFYHPGILAKDLLSHFLAKSARGIALNMIVDTDDEDISLHLPVRGKTGLLSRESFPISSTGIALVGQKIPAEAKENIMKRLSGYRKELYEVFVPSMVPQISEDLDSLTEIIRISEFVCEPGIRLRELWEKNHSIRLKTIYTSRIVQSESFQVFKEYIISREKEFRKIYNESLTEYRELHKIKNKAQPLPDLDEVSGELPFWVVKNGERRPFIQGSDINDINIYPRAVTLTLFCRIFISDLMIHGTGGARYDQITNRILERFFQYEAAPFSVASA
ncbi:MAG: hypothetical protein OEZ34_08340, partial [Spirochaetia bacterium]|nr:hypothetical protein [Spirochaetia bacterium]